MLYIFVIVFVLVVSWLFSVLLFAFGAVFVVGRIRRRNIIVVEISVSLVVLIICCSALRPIICISSRICVPPRVSISNIVVVKILIRNFSVWRDIVRIRSRCMIVIIMRMLCSHSAGSLSSYPYLY